MSKNNFWSNNKQANLISLKKLIKKNPTISVIEMASIFHKSVNAVASVLKRYNLRKKIITEIVDVEKNIVAIKPLKENSEEITYNKRTGTINGIENIVPVNWNIASSKRGGSGGKKSFKTYLIIADTHIPYEDKPAVTSVLSLMDDIKFDGFIILGDYLDFAPISHWLQDKKQNKSLENLRMRQDYMEGNKLLDEFDKRLPKKCDKRFFYGNHERWYYDLIEKMPALEGLLDPQIELKLKERGYTIYDKINHIERIGKLSLCHGHYNATNYVLKHIQEFKTNILHADLHSPRMRFENSPAKELAIAGYCVGCLCNMNPSYMKNRAHKWSHGLGVFYLFDDGNFDMDLKRIVRGRFIYNGRLYDGNI